LSTAGNNQLNWRINKLQMLLNNKKELSIDTSNNMDEPLEFRDPQSHP